MEARYWERIEQVFNEAVLLTGEERNSFLRECCADDKRLYEEVASLLSFEDELSGSLDEPVFPLVAQLLDDEFSGLLEGSDFANYKLHKIIGRGGMGAVFLAEDTSLQRPAAIKVLPVSTVLNSEYLLRFQQEARASSAISHPNVAHIYEFGLYNSFYFLAMEYVSGSTLRDLLEENKLDLAGSVKYALQIAKALLAAHGEGVTHRDIKPENIMINGTGNVKVLDFGIAKINNRKSSRNSQKNSSLQTDPGLIMGTQAYMSPEQIRGGAIDERTDIWSTGVVLYEMLTGNRPFEGETPSDIQAAILLKEASPLPMAKKIPGLQKIIAKALTKDVSHRYQKVEEMVEDLRAVQREVFDYVKQYGSTESDKWLLPVFLRRHKRVGIIVLLAACILVTIVSLAAHFGTQQIPNEAKDGGPKQLAVRQAIKVNNAGRAVRAAFSPNGAWLAYVIEEGGSQSLLVARFENEKLLESKILIPRSDKKYRGIAFTPDNQQIYFSAALPGKDLASLYRLSFPESADSSAINTVAANAPQKILDNIQNAPSFSPDGKQMAFLRSAADKSHENIYLADSDGTNERVLYSRKMPDYIPDLAQPAWSPDGRVIMCAGGTFNHGAQKVFPLAIRISDGQAQPAIEQPFEEIWHLSWIGDGSGYILSGRHEKSYDNKQLWHVSYPEGKVTRLTNDSNDYYGVSTSSTGSAVSFRNSGGEAIKVVSIVLNLSASLWKMDLSNSNKPSVRLTEFGNDSFGVSFSSSSSTRAAGQIVYGSMASGNPDIWIMNEDGTNRRQLTSDSHLDSTPVVTPDGRYIVFGSERSGIKALWRMNFDGAQQVRLTPHSSTEAITVSPDSRSVYFYSYDEGTGALWRVPVEGEAPSEKIADGEFSSPTVSPDNNFLAASFLDPATKEKMIAIWKINDLPSAPKQFLKPSVGEESEFTGLIRWAPDGHAITYVVNKKGVGNLWIQPIDGKPARQLTNFNAQRLYSFDFSGVGKSPRLIYSQGELTGYANVLLID